MNQWIHRTETGMEVIGEDQSSWTKHDHRIPMNGNIKIQHWLSFFYGQ